VHVGANLYIPFLILALRYPRIRRSKMPCRIFQAIEERLYAFTLAMAASIRDTRNVAIVACARSFGCDRCHGLQLFYNLLISIVIMSNRTHRRAKRKSEGWPHYSVPSVK
jgi:hypothetical protein